MHRCTLTFTALIILISTGMLSAQSIVCDGRTCGGSGVLLCDGQQQFRDYVYRVTGGAVPQDPDSVFIGTHDPDLNHYSAICLPTGWTYEIILMSRPDYSNPTNHGTVSPAADGNCPYTFLFRNVSGAPLSSSTPTDFGFNYYGYPHNVEWNVAAFPPVSADWAANVGLGAGPVHGPKCDTLCENGYPMPYYSPAGRKDNFATTDGPEPSSPSAALLALMQTISNGADPYFDSPLYDRCFGHTFTGWDASGCIVGAQLCFRITPITGGGNTDYFNIRENAGDAIWGCGIRYLKAWASGNPADTFWTVGDTLEVCLDLANMPMIKRGPTYYLPPNILATLQDGDMDFLMSDDTKIDFLELTLEVCTDTCYATGDVDGDGIALAVADLSALIAFVNGGILPAGPLWQCDLNGDGHVDQLDIDVYQCYFVQGMSCFPTFPVPLPTCYPDTVRGACCEVDSCFIKSSNNCAMASGTYQGDGTTCDPDPCESPDTIFIFGLEHAAIGQTTLDSSGGVLDIYNFENSEVTGVAIDFRSVYSMSDHFYDLHDEWDSLPVGASMRLDMTGVIDGVPSQYLGYYNIAKVDSGTWELTVDLGADSYTVRAWYGDEVVFYREGIQAEGQRHFI